MTSGLVWSGLVGPITLCRPISGLFVRNVLSVRLSVRLSYCWTTCATQHCSTRRITCRRAAACFLHHVTNYSLTHWRPLWLTTYSRPVHHCGHWRHSRPIFSLPLNTARALDYHCNLPCSGFRLGEHFSIVLRLKSSIQQRLNVKINYGEFPHRGTMCTFIPIIKYVIID